MDSNCPACGSDKIIPEVRIVDVCEGGLTDLSVQICGDPDALIFKDRFYGELKAIICGECGHTELKVTNPRELYKKYQESCR